MFDMIANSTILKYTNCLIVGKQISKSQNTNNVDIIGDNQNYHHED